MKKLSNEELYSINGGALKIAFGIASVLIAIVGIIDGYRNPLKCNVR